MLLEQANKGHFRSSHFYSHISYIEEISNYSEVPLYKDVHIIPGN